MESQLNKSFVPLEVQHIYIGKYDAVSTYATATINILADKQAEIVMYQSPNRDTTIATQIAYSGDGQLYSLTLALTQSYVYFTVRNTDVADMTVLQFTVMYSNAKQPIVRNTLQLTPMVSQASSPIDLSNSNSRLISIAGNGGDALVPIVLTVQFSSDGIFYYDSQYTYTIPIGVGQDFGWSFSTAFPFIRIASDNADNTTISAMVGAW